MDLHDDQAGLFWVSLCFPTKSTAVADGLPAETGYETTHKLWTLVL
jgi:hypothetical protein